MARRDELYGTPALRVADGLRAAFVVLSVVAAAIALTGWGGAAWLLVAGMTGAVASAVAVGVLGYRRAMRRPWPKVEPLPDEDDW